MSRVFPLAGLLRVRSLRESSAAGRLQAAREEQEATNSRIARFVESSEEGQQPNSPEALMAIAAARSSSRSLLIELKALAQQQDQHVKQAEADYLQATRETGAVEKLQSRFTHQQRQQELSIEQSVLDESAQRLRRNAQGRTGE